MYDYHQAVYNGLVTGVVARGWLGFTQNADLTILAHSLGNSLVGAAIAHHSLQVDQYYIINGAIPLQAYDPDQTGKHPDMKRNMTEDDWKPYYDYGQQRLFAANWHELFAGNPLDQRNKLTWKGFLAEPELLGVAYNFYSPSDEVVENADETEEFGDWGNIWDSAGGGGRHAWVQQEIAKGGQNPLTGSFFHELNGGWEFNYGPPHDPDFPGEPNPSVHGYSHPENLQMYDPQEAANSISNEDLKRVPFHRPFLFLDLYDPEEGSITAGVITNRYKLLGTAIPATSYAIAANAVEEFDEYGERNFNMPAEMKSPEGVVVWPKDENADAPGDWMHSDFKDVALQFVYPMYERMIDLAELDEE